MATLKDLLASFSGTTALFSQADFVFFPQTVQPFRILKPGHVQMVNDCMAGERLLTIPLLRKAEGDQGEVPPIFSIATMGYINEAQPLEGDQFNILVTGLVKVQVEEVDSDRPYRRAAVIPLTEFSQVTDAEHKRRSILRLFQSILDKAEVHSNIEVLQEADIPLSMLAHVIITALPIAAQEKQKMLELQSLELRIDILLNFLESGLHLMGAMGPFEPILPSQPWWN